jgi:hypothetical protein
MYCCSFALQKRLSSLQIRPSSEANSFANIQLRIAFVVGDTNALAVLVVRFGTGALAHEAIGIDSAS